MSPCCAHQKPELPSPKPVVTNPSTHLPRRLQQWLFSGPVGGRLYLGRYALAAGVFLAGMVADRLAVHWHDWELLVAALIFEVLSLVYVIGYAILPRIDSTGLNRWWFLLCFLPVVNLAFLLFLLFCPANQFGGPDSTPPPEGFVR